MFLSFYSNNSPKPEFVADIWRLQGHFFLNWHSLPHKETQHTQTIFPYLQDFIQGLSNWKKNQNDINMPATLMRTKRWMDGWWKMFKASHTCSVLIAFFVFKSFQGPDVTFKFPFKLVDAWYLFSPSGFMMTWHHYFPNKMKRFNLNISWHPILRSEVKIMSFTSKQIRVSSRSRAWNSISTQNNLRQGHS